MYNSTSGNNNTAVGTYALYSNKANSRSTAVGFDAMYWSDDRITGRETHSTTVGYEALKGSSKPANNTGQYNTAVGDGALINATSGCYNTACGTGTLLNNKTGYNNVAIGVDACKEADSYNNTCVGTSAGYVGSFTSSTSLGAYAGILSSPFTNCMALGYNASVSANNKVVIGNTSVNSIGGFAGWSNFSDGRFKKNVREGVPGLEFIRFLRPVIYSLDVTALNADQCKNLNEERGDGRPAKIISQEELDGIRSKENLTYSGFIAQEVEAAAKKIGYDFNGVDAPGNPNDYYGLRYGEFAAPLVKAIQEQQVEIEQLKAEN